MIRVVLSGKRLCYNPGISMVLCRLVLALLGLLGLFLGSGLPVVLAQEGTPEEAQEELQVRLAPVELGNFPEVSSYLDVRTGGGQFVYGLEAADVQIIEDGKQIPVNNLSLLRQGAQFVLAVSPGSSFTIRDGQGFTRYDYLVQALQGWVNSKPQGSADDLSFLALDGPDVTHAQDPDTWLAGIESYQPSGGATLPGFDVLGRALEIAMDQTPRPGMGRAILFITPPPEEDVSLGLQSLAARAVQRGVRIYVWMVASGELFASPGADQLADLAAQTGGTMLAYSGIEQIPSLEEYLEPLRNTYYLFYQSQVSSSGTHQVRAELQSEGQAGVSPDQEFEIEVMAPHVAFVSPPTQIQRSYLSTEEGGTAAPADLIPTSYTLEVMITFPDGHERPLVSTKLLVDGNSNDVNTAPPFEQFTWDLSSYTTSGTHNLRVEALDSLGNSSASAEIPVVITIEAQEPNALATISDNRTLLAGLVVVVAGAVLALVLVLGGRLRPAGWIKTRRRTGDATQPSRVKAPPAPRMVRRSNWKSRLHFPHRAVPPKIYALLVPQSDSSQESPGLPIVISNPEMSFGRDPLLANQIIDDPSLDGLHARLIHQADGTFQLFDVGSVSGTWVNYKPVTQEGICLEHGDLIHFGRMSFRFQVREPKQVRKPVARPKEPAL